MKGANAACPAVKQGGTIIIVAGLAEGLGKPAFCELIEEMSSLEEFGRCLQDPDFFREDQYMLQEHLKASRKADVILYSDGVPFETQERAFAHPAHSAEEAIERGLQKHGPDATICAIPDGPYVIPVLGGKS